MSNLTLQGYVNSLFEQGIGLILGVATIAGFWLIKISWNAFWSMKSDDQDE